MLWRKDVRTELAGADVVSFKVDAAVEATWRCINRPAGKLDFKEMIDGQIAFATEYRGRLLTETMLVSGLNDASADLQATARLVAKLRP